jgi:hypothetical protein
MAHPALNETFVSRRMERGNPKRVTKPLRAGLLTNNMSQCHHPFDDPPCCHAAKAPKASRAIAIILLAQSKEKVARQRFHEPRWQWHLADTKPAAFKRYDIYEAAFQVERTGREREHFRNACAGPCQDLREEATVRWKLAHGSQSAPALSRVQIFSLSVRRIQGAIAAFPCRALARCDAFPQTVTGQGLLIFSELAARLIEH